MYILGIPELAAYLRLDIDWGVPDQPEWGLIAADWVTDHEKDPRTQAAWRKFTRFFFPKRASGEFQAAARVMDVAFSPIRQSLSKEKHLRKWIRVQIPEMVATILTGIRSTFYAVNTLAEQRPSTLEVWKREVNKLLRTPRLAQMVRIELSRRAK